MKRSPDANDIARTHGVEGLREHVDGATVLDMGRLRREQTRHDWPELDMRLVDDDRIPAPVLSEHLLPSGWSNWILEEAESLSCAADYIAAGVVGCASAWVGNARRIIGTSTFSAPSHLWFALIGGPSAKKTPAIDPVIRISELIQREEKARWRAENAAMEVKPPRPRLVVKDATVEAVQKLLAENPRGLLSLRDELSGWLASFNQYRGGNGSDREFWCEAYNGASYSSDRIKFDGNPISIEHCSVAIVGGMVPDRLREALAGADDGLAARFLFVWPNPLPIGPLVDRGDIETKRRRDTLARAARRLRGLHMGEELDGTPAPHALRLDDFGRRLLDDIYIKAMTCAEAASGMAASWHGKNPGRALRLALVYELLAWAGRCDSDPEPSVVSEDSLIRAADYLEYAAAMFHRIEGGLSIERSEVDAAKIARYLRDRRIVELNERELYQTAGWAWFRKKESRERALRILEDGHWIRRPGSAVAASQGGRPRHDWEVSPRVLEDLK
jgi:hypothetical protein